MWEWECWMLLPFPLLGKYLWRCLLGGIAECLTLAVSCQVLRRLMGKWKYFHCTLTWQPNKLLGRILRLFWFFLHTPMNAAKQPDRLNGNNEWQSAFKLNTWERHPLSVLISQNFWPFLARSPLFGCQVAPAAITSQTLRHKTATIVGFLFANLIVSPELTIWFQCLRRRRRRRWWWWFDSARLAKSIKLSWFRAEASYHVNALIL